MGDVTFYYLIKHNINKRTSGLVSNSLVHTVRLYTKGEGGVKNAQMDATYWKCLKLPIYTERIYQQSSSFLKLILGSDTNGKEFIRKVPL